jgi:diguanylate cyclase (GGDEF)-like protein
MVRCRSKKRKPVELWNKATLKSLFLPGVLLFAASLILLQGRPLPLSAAAVNFYYLAVLISGVLLAIRFRSGRVCSALIILFLAHRAIEFFAAGGGVLRGPGRTAFEAVALLLPLNFMALSFVRERGWTPQALAPRLGLLFVESVFVAVISRPDETAPAFLHPAILSPGLFHWTKVPQIAWLAFAAAIGVLLVRFLRFRKPVESGLLWSLATAFCALQAGGVGSASRAYVATSGLVLIGSLIENFYVLAYHDELTTLPARRAFNESLLRLEHPFAIAVVDIDHFKSFNDTYGHETGDQVLRMVAVRLAHVTGGGQAFRVGGEEFCLLFPGKSAAEATEHLELLRRVIEASTFRTRVTQDRRRIPHGPDRRQPARRATRSRPAPPQDAASQLSVTVSVGVADSTLRNPEVARIVEMADKALYRAKHNGRNRVEVFAPTRSRATRRTA